LKTEKETHFRAQYIQKFTINCLENRSKTPTRGNVCAKTYVSISNIASLLTALTAFKVGRHDLIRVPGAFRRLNIWATRSNLALRYFE